MLRDLGTCSGRRLMQSGFRSLHERYCYACTRRDAGPHAAVVWECSLHGSLEPGALPEC